MNNQESHEKDSSTNVLDLFEEAMRAEEEGEWQQAKIYLLRIKAITADGMYAEVATQLLQRIIAQEPRPKDKLYLQAS